MPYTTMPIVGAHYRPPAKAIISVLPVGTPLYLLAEPENPYDVNAVAVWIRTGDIPETAHTTLDDELLPPSGHSLDTLLAQDEWHLGYVPKELAAQLRAADIVPDGKPIDVTFTLNATSQPRVRFAEPVL